MKQTAEGIKSSQAVHELAGKLGVDMPITAAVVAVLAGKLVRRRTGAAAAVPGPETRRRLLRVPAKT